MTHQVDFKGYHLIDYLFLIKREQSKRASAYPKILAKADKGGTTLEELEFLSKQLIFQSESLNNVYRIIIGELGNEGSVFSQIYYQIWLKDAIEELVREMNCRIQYYPRMIYRKRVTSEKAAEETALWKALIEFLKQSVKSFKMRKYKVKFEVLGKFYETTVEALTPYGAIAATEAKIKKTFSVHSTDEISDDSELDALGKVIFGEGWKTKPNF
jgi:hypothetical protein